MVQKPTLRCACVFPPARHCPRQQVLAGKTGVDILDGVGSTEMLHIFLSSCEGDAVYGTSGVAVPGANLRLVGEDGNEVDVGEIGELLVAAISL